MNDQPDGWGEDACVVCPARCGLGPGQFDVVDGPGPEYRLDRSIGWRVDVRTGVGVCVHPYRIGIAPGRYLSGDQAILEDGEQRPMPSAAALVMPEDETDLEGWLVAVLRVAPADELFPKTQWKRGLDDVSTEVPVPVAPRTPSAAAPHNAARPALHFVVTATAADTVVAVFGEIDISHSAELRAHLADELIVSVTALVR